MDTNDKAADLPELPETRQNEDPDHLRKLLKVFTAAGSDAGHRKARLEDLMVRESTKRWTPTKTAKMVRRYTTATKAKQEAESTIDYINQRLEAHAATASQ